MFRLSSLSTIINNIYIYRLRTISSRILLLSVSARIKKGKKMIPAGELGKCHFFFNILKLQRKIEWHWLVCPSPSWKVDSHKRRKYHFFAVIQLKCRINEWISNTACVCDRFIQKSLIGWNGISMLIVVIWLLVLNTHAKNSLGQFMRTMAKMAMMIRMLAELILFHIT